MSGGPSPTPQPSPIHSLHAKLLPAPDYYGALVRRRVFPGVWLIWTCNRRYIEVRRFGVFHRV